MFSRNSPNALGSPLRVPSRLALSVLIKGQETPKIWNSKALCLTAAQQSPKSHPAACLSHYVARCFIHAMVRACRCDGLEKQFSSSLATTSSRLDGTAIVKLKMSYSHRLVRCFSTRLSRHAHIAANISESSREELRNIVDSYSWHSDDRPSRSSSSTTKTSNGRKHIFDAGEANFNTNLEDHIRRAISNRDERTQLTISNLTRLLKDPTTSHELIMDKYHKIPPPRTAHLPDHLLRELLHHLSIVEHKDEASMLRYLEVFGDARSTGRSLSRTEWTSAIAFVGRCFKKVSTAELGSALQLWKEMEVHTGVQSTHITFNVLFDIATKAGKFALADMLMQEMKTRDLPFNRHFRTGLIYHYGLRHDSDGVRKAYHDLVDAGDPVDTAVISCLIASLLHCGESVAAENVFERMKRLHAAHAAQPLPPGDWRKSRELSRSMDSTVKQSTALSRRKSDAISDDQAQPRLPHIFAPDLHTYRVLIYYYAVTSGNLDRVVELVDEMPHYNIPANGQIFVYVFRGFAMHGGVPYTPWTRRRLERTFEAFCFAVDDPEQEAYITVAAVELIIRAFAVCAPPSRLMEVWKELLGRWKEEDRKDDELQRAEALLGKLSQNPV